MDTTGFDESRPAPPQTARITALFTRGEHIVVGEDELGEIHVWVAALSEAEREEAILDGAAAQARVRVLSGEGSETYQTLLNTLQESSRDDLIAGMLSTRNLEAWEAGQNDLHAEEYWRGDRLLVIERGDAVLRAGGRPTPEETSQLETLNDEYLAQWRAKALARLQRIREEDYDHLDNAALTALYIRAWQDAKSSKAQMREYRYSQLFYGARVCRATKGPEGRYGHRDCEGHQLRLFPDLESVRNCPDSLIEALAPAADRLDRQGAEALGK